jgi:hypothetical protein
VASTASSTEPSGPAEPTTLRATKAEGVDERSRLLPVIRPVILRYPNDEWVLKIEGMEPLRVPKTVDANRKWRLDLLELADADVEVQDHLWELCRRSPIFFINAFLFTYKKRDYTQGGKGARVEDPNFPFCTWPVQDQLVEELVRSINDQEDILIDKSRDMGATWIVMAVFVWFFLFVPNIELLCMSRKEDLVDERFNINSLFGKVDYMLDLLPPWMQPELDRTKNKIFNRDNGSLLDGESTNRAAGRSQRYDAAMLDEFAMVEATGVDAWEIARSLTDTTFCRIFNSTPKGPETAFTKIRKSGMVPTFVLHWINHPEKGSDREQIVDEATGMLKWTSSYYKVECAKRGYDRIDIAINLDINHIGSGSTFFDELVIGHRKAQHSRAPDQYGTLTWSDEINWQRADQNLQSMLHQTVAFHPRGGDRRLRLWCPMFTDRRTGRPRPDQNTMYVVGADISHGTGASNTVFSVGDVTTRKKVAEWAFGNIDPADAARACVALMLWIGGSRPALIVPENNGGAGGTFINELVELKWRNIYHQRSYTTKGRERSLTLGWNSTRKSKGVLLGMLRQSWERDDIEIPSVESYDEAEMYVFTGTGALEPAEVAHDATARATHGDRVIADALMVLGIRENKHFRPVAKHAQPGSLEDRLNKRRRAKRAEETRSRSERKMPTRTPRKVL